MNTYEKINALAQGMEEKLIAQRRDFHKYAETGWFEMRTTSIIARHLKDLGYEVLLGNAVCKKSARMGVPPAEKLKAHYEWAQKNGADPEFLPYTKGGMTGVIGILRCGEGPTVAMRFDIDALGVIESEEADHLPYAKGFASVNKGAMHSCGHDAHATVGMGVAETLMAIKDQLQGTIKLIFQPAEEGVRGAKSIVENGHLDGVDYFLGSHVTSRSEGSNEELTPGTHGSLATTKFDVFYQGKSAHAGGAPHTGNNALQAAASAVLNLYAIPRHGKGATRINVGTLVAGSGRNVIADEAKMEIELRGETTEINDYVCQAAMRVLKNSAQIYGCTCKIKLMGAADSAATDLDFAEHIQKVCRQAGLVVTDELSMRIGGSEDVCYMIARVQQQGGKAAFMRLRTEFAGPGHNRRFDIGEGVLVRGVRAFSCVTADLLAKK